MVRHARFWTLKKDVVKADSHKCWLKIYNTSQKLYLRPQRKSNYLTNSVSLYINKAKR